MAPQFKAFVTSELPAQLRTLTATQAPNFGLMTAHHMVEHLVYVTKSLPKRHGEPGGEPNKSQLYFRKFIESGCPFEHRPKPDATLNALRTSSMEEAIQLLEGANERFYTLFDSHPDYTSYNSRMGSFNLAELETFLYQHGRWHLHQFGIIEVFEPLSV